MRITFLDNWTKIKGLQFKSQAVPTNVNINTSNDFKNY